MRASYLSICFLSLFSTSLGLIPMVTSAKTSVQDITHLLQKSETLPVSVEERMEENRTLKPKIMGPNGFVKAQDCSTPSSGDALTGLCLIEPGSAPRASHFIYTVNQRAVRAANAIDAEGQINVPLFHTNEVTAGYPLIIPKEYAALLEDRHFREAGKNFDRPFRYAWRLIGNDLYLNIQEVPHAFWDAMEASATGSAKKLVGAWERIPLPSPEMRQRALGTDFPLDLATDLQSIKTALLRPDYPFEINPATIRESSFLGQPSVRFGIRIKPTYIQAETARQIQEHHVTSTKARTEIASSIRHDTALLGEMKQTWTIHRVTGRILEAHNHREMHDTLPIGCIYNKATRRDVCKNTLLRRTIQDVVTRYRYDQSQPILPPEHSLLIEPPAR